MESSVPFTYLKLALDGGGTELLFGTIVDCSGAYCMDVVMHLSVIVILFMNCGELPRGYEFGKFGSKIHGRKGVTKMGFLFILVGPEICIVFCG